MKVLFVLISMFLFISHAKAEDTTLKAKVETATEAPASSGEFSDMVCTNGAHKRVVELISGSAETKLPCEVHYKKETEQPGHDQVLWSANTDVSFCHAKAAAFIDKLSGMGWSCSAK